MSNILPNSTTSPQNAHVNIIIVKNYGSDEENNVINEDYNDKITFSITVQCKLPYQWLHSASAKNKSAPPLKSEIRHRLKRAFDAVEFDAFCLDHFEEVFDQFATGMRLDQKITLLLAYCRHQSNGLERLNNYINDYTI